MNSKLSIQSSNKEHTPSSTSQRSGFSLGCSNTQASLSQAQYIAHQLALCADAHTTCLPFCQVLQGFMFLGHLEELAGGVASAFTNAVNATVIQVSLQQYCKPASVPQLKS